MVMSVKEEDWLKERRRNSWVKAVMTIFLARSVINFSVIVVNFSVIVLSWSQDVMDTLLDMLTSLIFVKHLRYTGFSLSMSVYLIYV